MASVLAAAKDKKKFLYLSIFLNLGILCIFKYFNFFIDSFYLFLENHPPVSPYIL